MKRSRGVKMLVLGIVLCGAAAALVALAIVLPPFPTEGRRAGSSTVFLGVGAFAALSAGLWGVLRFRHQRVEARFAAASPAPLTVPVIVLPLTRTQLDAAVPGELGRRLPPRSFAAVTRAGVELWADQETKVVGFEWRAIRTIRATHSTGEPSSLDGISIELTDVPKRIDLTLAGAGFSGRPSREQADAVARAMKELRPA